MNTISAQSKCRTVVHDRAVNFLASIMNTEFSNKPFKAVDVKSLKTEHTSKSENDCFTYDLKTSLDEDRDEIVLLTEVKTTQQRGRALDQIVRSQFQQHDKKQFTPMMHEAMSRANSNKFRFCYWSILIAIHKPQSQILAQSNSSPDHYNLLFMFGRDDYEFSFRFYKSFRALESQLQKIQTLSHWLETNYTYVLDDDFACFKDIECSFDDIKEQIELQLISEPEEPKSEEPKPKRIYKNKFIMINQEQVDQLIVKLSERKMKNKEIADHFNVSLETLRRWKVDPSHPNHELIMQAMNQPKTEEVIIEHEPIELEPMLIEHIWKSIGVALIIIAISLIVWSCYEIYLS